MLHTGIFSCGGLVRLQNSKDLKISQKKSKQSHTLDMSDIYSGIWFRYLTYGRTSKTNIDSIFRFHFICKSCPVNDLHCHFSS